MVNQNQAALFIHKALAAGAEVRVAGSLGMALRDIAELFSAGRISKIIASAGLRFLLQDKEGIPLLDPQNPRDFGQAQAGIVQADFGVSETGTLVHLDSTDEEKMTWTLPPLCVCLVEREKIVACLEDLSPVFNHHLSQATIPGPQVSLVTGPSRTADIECQTTIGVHGPSRLVIFIIDEKKG